MLRRVAGIIQRCENEILNDFYAGSLQSAQPQQPTANTSRRQQTSNPPSQQTLNLPSHPHPNQPQAQNQPSEVPISPTTNPAQSEGYQIDDASSIPPSFWTDPVDEMPLPSSFIDWNTVFPFTGSGGDGMDYDGLGDMGNGGVGRMTGVVYS